MTNLKKKNFCKNYNCIHFGVDKLYKSGYKSQTGSLKLLSNKTKKINEYILN